MIQIILICYHFLREIIHIRMHQTYNWMSNTNGRRGSLNNKQAMIVFDLLYPEYGGYNIEFSKSFALNLYLS